MSRKAASLDELINKISTNFININWEKLAKDVHDFYAMLEDGGFIVSGNTESELDSKDKKFLYNNFSRPGVYYNSTPTKDRVYTTQDFLVKHFKNNPQLLSFQIELTSRCNERCIHCYIPHQNKIDDIEPALFYDTLHQCSEMGVLDITLSGGEPLLHPEFCHFLKKASEYDFSISILSNLTLLNDAIIDTIKKSMMPISIQVSLYSMNPMIHDSITNLPGSFYRTRDSILRLIDEDIPLQISCPTMEKNKNDFMGVMEWAFEHHIRVNTDYIMMARYDHTIGNLDNRLSPDEAGTIINELISHDTSYQQRLISDMNTQHANTVDVSEDIVCGICITSFCMVANGNTYPCPGWQDFICGNLYEQQLKDIWFNSDRTNYLRGIRKKDFPKCLHCQDIDYCNLCMARNANENNETIEIPGGGTVVGNPLKINKHFCKVAALNHKIVLDWKNKMQMKKNV